MSKSTSHLELLIFLVLFRLLNLFLLIRYSIFFFSHLSSQSFHRCHRDAQHGFESIIDIVQGYHGTILFTLDKVDHIEHQLFYLLRKLVAFRHIAHKDTFEQ